jgi:cathepsin F
LDDFIEKTHSEKDHKEFRSFMENFDKKYDSQEEYTYRLGIFKENMKKVTLLENSEQGTAKYGPTIFADLTEEKFSKHHLGLRPDLKQGFKKVKKAKVPFLTSIPDEFDWRNYNAVTPVKNQGMCGSCWAFSVTGNIEGLYAKKHNKLMSFSEQGKKYFNY